MRKKSLIPTVVFALALALPSTALAANVSADCGTGGVFNTRGTADNWQDHVHDGTLWHTWYYGRLTKTKNWGFESGMEYGTVNGPNLTGATAFCPG